MATINFLDFIDGQLFRVIMDNHFKSQVHKNQRNMKISGFNDRRFYQCTQNIFLITPKLLPTTQTLQVLLCFRFEIAARSSQVTATKIC